MTLPAFAAERRAAALLLLGAGAPAVDRYDLPAGRSAANPPHAAAAVERWDQRTDGRTDGWTDAHRYTDAYYAGTVSNVVGGIYGAAFAMQRGYKRNCYWHVSVYSKGRHWW